MFEITTEAHGRRSQTTKTRVRTMPLITSEITVINQPEVTTALTLRYTPTPLTSALFDTYRYLNTAHFLYRFLDAKKTTRSQFSVPGLQEIHRNLKQQKSFNSHDGFF